VTLDDRDTYRCMSNSRLLLHYHEYGPSAELAVALAERLEGVLTNPEAHY